MLRQSERRLCIQRCICHLVKENLMSTNSYRTRMELAHFVRTSA